jgi:hypothetical protein
MVRMSDPMVGPEAVVLNATEMYLTYVPVDHGPRELCAELGFTDSGVDHEGELEMKLEL